MLAPKLGTLVILSVFYTCISGQPFLASCPPKRCFNAFDCPYGYKQDTTGCQTCECNNPPRQSTSCPPLRCSQRTRCIYGYQVNSRGCRTCHCASKCPSRECFKTMECYDGFRKNSIGCNICECIPTPRSGLEGDCPFRSCKFCENGHVLDDKGCKTCECLETRVACPVPLCSRNCPNGYKFDNKNCQTCECKIGPSWRCPPACTNGLECRANSLSTDSNGCQRCECEPLRFFQQRVLPITCTQDRDCGSGFTCQNTDIRLVPNYRCMDRNFINDGLCGFAAECPPDSNREPRCVSLDRNARCMPACTENCGSLVLQCEHGLEMDSKGCAICRCRTQSPCGSCGSNQRCEFFGYRSEQVRTCEVSNFVNPCATARCGFGPCQVLDKKAFCLASACPGGSRRPCSPCPDGSQPTRTPDPRTGCPGTCSPCTAPKPRRNTPTCDTVTCRRGETCEMRPQQCRNPPCALGPQCVDECGPAPECEPPCRTDRSQGCPLCVCPAEQRTCASMSCPRGQTCVMKQVTCVRAPCPSEPVCESSSRCQPLPSNCDVRCRTRDASGCEICSCPSEDQSPTCASTTCRVGEVCVMKQVQCVRAPCPEQPTCERGPQGVGQGRRQAACPQIACQSCNLGSFLFHEQDGNGCRSRCNCVSFYQLCYPGRCRAGTECIVQSSYCRPGRACPPPEIVCLPTTT